MSGVSGDLLDHYARTLIARAPDLHTALDIGPGRGKYGRMVRALRPEVHLTAMEVDGDYVEQFDLRALYDHVRVAPAYRLLESPDAEWDIAFLGDVLEHMPKSQGLDVLHYLVYRTRYLWVQYPNCYRQGALAGHASEAHMSIWTRADFDALHADYLWYECEFLRGVVINGYANAGAHIYEVMEDFGDGRTNARD